ncbi:MAG: hypothetical protein FWB75_04180, partial [Oscillospiraceae bacterium]|nr:hypothetical protein [Oscillospiraceae bacterium]
LSASDAFSITHFDEFVCFFILLMVFPQSLFIPKGVLNVGDRRDMAVGWYVEVHTCMNLG